MNKCKCFSSSSEEKLHHWSEAAARNKREKMRRGGELSEQQHLSIASANILRTISLQDDTSEQALASRPACAISIWTESVVCASERESARHDTVNIYCNIFRFIISQRWRGSCHLRAPACCAPNESPGFLYAWRSDNKCNVKNRLIFLHMDFFLSHSHPAVGIYTRSERKNWRKRGSAACLL